MINHGPVWELLRYPEVTLRQQVPLQVCMNLNLSTSELHFVFQISQPPNIAQKWFFMQNLQMDLNFSEEFFSFLRIRFSPELPYDFVGM